jgi:hypothetical protein
MKLTRLHLLLLLLCSCLAFWGGLLGLHAYYQEETYALIEPGLYLGAPVEEQPLGTQVVLNLCELADPYHCEVHLWKPIRDGAPGPPMTWLRTQVDFLTAQRQAGRTTFVHCLSGRSRSGMVITAYLMAEHGWTRDDAMAFVRTKWPSTRPNRVFMESLAVWERVLSADGAAGE